MVENKLTTISKIWSTGRGHVVTIPMNIMKARHWEKGDLIEVDWGEIVERPKKVEEKEDLPEL